MGKIRNRTQNQYTNVANGILKDKNLGIRERGLLVTLLSLPDGWEYSIKGLNAIMPASGITTLSTAAKNLEKERYLVRKQAKKGNGQFDGYEWEIFEEPQIEKPLTDFPSTGNLLTENLQQYNTKEYSTKQVSNESINPSDLQMEKIQRYTEIIKNNIEYDSLIVRFGIRENAIMEELVGVIIELVAIERKSVRIEKTNYPYQFVKSQFLKLRVYHIEEVVKSLMENKNKIRNMKAYMITTLFNATMATENLLQSEANYYVANGVIAFESN